MFPRNILPLSSGSKEREARNEHEPNRKEEYKVTEDKQTL
jgi:hypothetical protein